MTLSKYLPWLIVLTVCVNALAMLSPVIDSGDAITYATIAQQMARSHDWIRLMLDGKDWLDKPHFPFWVTALSFQLGGVSALTYILPGFLFHLLGAYYTYRLARLLYDGPTGLVAVLVYVSAFNLMDSGVEIKAEAYLRAQILAACYYWWRYDRQFRVRDLLLGALFTGMAMMTKGLFVLITISSGFLCLWAYRGQWLRWCRAKWFAALALSLLATAPELIALHIQFDLHPGGGVLPAGTSAFRFFFWDSQFGRFFNTGPIQNHGGYPLFFVLVFLYGFLPWTFVALAAVRTQAGRWRASAPAERESFVFLGSLFLCSFVMFSATKFQMSYYIDILLPFAAILCARYLGTSTVGRPLLRAQMGVVVLLTVLTLGIGVYVRTPLLLAPAAAMAAGLAYCAYRIRGESPGLRAVVLPVLAINLVYVFTILLSYSAFTRYSVPVNAARVLAGQPPLPIYVLDMPEVYRELGLYTTTPTRGVETGEALRQIPGRYYLVARHEASPQLPLDPAHLRRIATLNLVVHKSGTLDKLLRLARGTWPLETIDVLECGQG